MCRFQQGYKDHEELVHLTAPKETNKVPVTDSKEMQIYAQFRMILLKKFSKLQEYTDR